MSLTSPWLLSTPLQGNTGSANQGNGNFGTLNQGEGNTGDQNM